MNEQHFIKEVEDARMLLDFVMKERPRLQDDEATDGRVPLDIVKAINDAENQIVKDHTPGQDPDKADAARGEQAHVRGVLTSETVVAFEDAYQQLVQLAKPVTAETLKATADEHGFEWWLFPWKGKLSVAEIWSRKLWFGTILLIGLAVTGEMLLDYVNQFLEAPDGENRWARSFYFIADLLNHLTPFTYGGIGACAFLLRSAHHYIYRREFDPRRIPEYLNRILLGVVSGGAVVLFIDQVTDDSGGVIKLGASALGFLAGYNTDFLFNTIERVVAAILPKVELTSVRRGPAAHPLIDTVSLGDLLKGMAEAKTDEERAIYASLIKKVETRL